MSKKFFDAAAGKLGIHTTETTTYPVPQPTTIWYCQQCWNANLRSLRINRSYHSDIEKLETFGGSGFASVVGPSRELVDFTCEVCGWCFNGEQRQFEEQAKALLRAYQQAPPIAGAPIVNGRVAKMNNDRTEATSPEELEALRLARVDELLKLREELR